FVLSVCRRILGDAHAAEDALQATFMVLARKAATLDIQTPLAGWLFKVAYHIALRLRAAASRMKKSETGAAIAQHSESGAESSTELERQELRRVLYAELQDLPERYRTPLELCYLDGRTHAEAAHEIGLPRGSMAKRIGEALVALRERLIVR